jgi:hemin uptake protein HemP
MAMIAHPAPAGVAQDTVSTEAREASGSVPDLAPHRGSTATSPTVEVMPSAALLRGGRAVAIEHNGEIYRLQSTRSGKLILTK